MAHIAAHNATLYPVTIEPLELKHGDRLGFKVVAVIGVGNGDWSAYKGPTHWSDDRVAVEGTKIDRTTAERLFPTLRYSGNPYRE